MLILILSCFLNSSPTYQIPSNLMAGNEDPVTGKPIKKDKDEDKGKDKDKGGKGK